MPRKKIAVLGGGLTGLALANLLKKDHEISVFEKEKIPGGLCRSFYFDGFTFDIGGHIIFSKDQEALNFVIKTIGRKNLYEKPCRDSILYKNKLINYPFETDLAKLGKSEAFECLRDFLTNTQKEAANFHQWLHLIFGKSLAEKYLVPYNRKIWKIEPKMLDMNWVARIPKPATEEMIKSCLGIPFDIKIARKKFFYPKAGGIQVLINKLAEKIGKSLNLGSEIIKVKKSGKGWLVQTKQNKEYFDDIISTLPIFNLLKILDEKIPKNIVSVFGNLRYNSIMVVCLGINSPKVTKNTAIYVPDENFYPNRLCFMNNFSPQNAPRGKNSVICEITFHPKSNLAKMKDKVILKNTIDGLHSRKIIDKNKIIFKKVLRFPYAYVVYDKNYGKNTKKLYGWLKSKKIHTVGRFAEFQYLNMDACIRHAIDFSNNYSK